MLEAGTQNFLRYRRLSRFRAKQPRASPLKSGIASLRCVVPGVQGAQKPVRARKLIADRLKESAKRGRASLTDLIEVREKAVAQVNDADDANGWRTLFQWSVL